MSHTEHEEITDPIDYFRVHPEFHECRKYGHAFRPTHDGYLIEGPVRNPITLYTKLKCRQDCGLTAEDTFHPRTYERIGHRRIFYSDAPEYLAHGTHVTRLDARIWEAKNRGARRGEPRRSKQKVA